MRCRRSAGMSRPRLDLAGSAHARAAHSGRAQRAWAVDADHDNLKNPYGDLWLTVYRELAALYGMSVIGVSCVGWLTGGPWKGRKCIGNSIAVGPGGQVLAMGPYGVDAESLTVVEVSESAPIARGAGFADTRKERDFADP